ncbi:MAG: DUF169 domain-containing protein [Halobacteriota archaeon]|nr:DUF169 domain-containing protein [Halobacteriota archaeon]
MESREKLERIASRLNELLRPKTFPTGVKLLKNIDEVDGLKKVRRPDEEVAICQLISYARLYGWTIAGTADDNLCPLGEAVLGFVEPPKALLSGDLFYMRYQATRKAAKKMADLIPRIEPGKYSAILAAPLSKFPLDPDLVVIYGNSAQMMRLIHGMLWKEGGRLNFGSSGEGVCADYIAQPLVTGDPQLAIPCYGDRRFGAAQDEELVMGIPYKMMEDVVEGLEKTSKSGTRYPIPTQLSTPKAFLIFKK